MSIDGLQVIFSGSKKTGTVADRSLTAELMHAALEQVRFHECLTGAANQETLPIDDRGLRAVVRERSVRDFDEDSREIFAVRTVSESIGVQTTREVPTVKALLPQRLVEGSAEERLMRLAFQWVAEAAAVHAATSGNNPEKVKSLLFSAGGAVSAACQQMVESTRSAVVSEFDNVSGFKYRNAHQFPTYVQRWQGNVIAERLFSAAVSF